MRHPRFIVHRAKTKPFIKGPGLRRGMGVKKIEPGAGVGNDRDQQLLADAPATIAFADVEVANAPSSVSPGALKRFLPLCQFSARRRSILKCCSRLSIRSAANPGASGVVAAINRGGIASSIKSSRDARRAPAGGRFPAPLRCDLNLNQRNCFRTASSSCNTATMSFRIKIIISIPPIRASPVVKEHNKLTYLSAARCQLIPACRRRRLPWPIVRPFHERLPGPPPATTGVRSAEPRVAARASDCTLLT